MFKRLFTVLVLLCLTAGPVYAADPGLVVLQDTGHVTGALPVLKADPAPGDVLEVLSKGFSGHMLRLYQYEQTYLNQKTGAAVEPAYLLLSNHEGGFPRFGFVLDGTNKPEAGFVDLHKNDRTRPVGHAGALDQIFPHELFHVIRQQLAGPRDGPSGKLHAVGVQTDPATALDEGFAESMQMMAVDDPEADPATRAEMTSLSTRADMVSALASYRQALEARWAPGARYLLTFPQWFSGNEQLARYWLVKENAYARQPRIPDRLVGSVSGQMLANILPGDPGDPPKSAAQMLATEGVISHLFYAWATNITLQNSYRDDAFYAQFGATRNQISPVENVYLKLFHVFYVHKPKDAAQVITAYQATFSDEAAAVSDIASETFLGQSLPVSGSIWLMNDSFRVGVNLYDQMRSPSTPNVFDLNAATLTDLVTVNGVDRALAAEILRGAPYLDLNALARVPGMKPEVLERFHQMADAYERARKSTEEGSGISGALAAYVWRILLLLAVAWTAATPLFRWQQRVSWWRAAVNGLVAAGFGLGITLLLAIMNHGGLRPGPEGLVALVFVLVFFGVPAAMKRLVKRRGAKEALRALVAWALAALPVAILVHPWF